MTAAAPGESDQQALLDQYGAALLGIAYAAIDRGLRRDPKPLPVPAHPPAKALQRQGASFVTLYVAGGLRGCIGSPRPVRPLAADVAANAFAAAFEDRRFAPLRRDERPDLAVSISLLSEPEALAFVSEDDLSRQLRPFHDGLILEHGAARALFLPQVWASLPEPRAFLAQLKEKAGIGDDTARDLVAWRFTVAAVRSPGCAPPH